MPITDIAVNCDLNVLVSCSQDGTAVIHTLSSGKYLRTVYHPHGSGFERVVVGHMGTLALYSSADRSVHVYTVNGYHISEAVIDKGDDKGSAHPHSPDIPFLAVDPSEELLITAGE